MPFDSNGVYSLPNGYLAVTGQTILASQHNPPLQDIQAALSQLILRSGVAPFSGNQSMAGFKITNAANGVADGDYVTMSQLTAVIASVTAGVVPTGAVAGFRMTTPPTGWIKENGGTIGSAASGATNRANADTQALFTLLWTNFDQTALPIQNSSGAVTTRGASAAADFAAAKRMPLFDSRSRFLRGADDGLGYDVAIVVGLAQDDLIKNHTHPITDLGHAHAQQGSGSPGATTTANYSNSLTAAAQQATNTATATTGITIQNNTGGGSETRPRASAVLHCIKL
ncbi:hypothetical protein [Ensifer sp. SL37]|uniref:hypothetical protein n=1 Tax=Ensifer sp. SL37 TaxID=2995137 RepID=UPI0022723484|nr:hypothetical protein [Ensifer sp. SL37]MCY1741152.1 hypothetical protein [Ensifer sp. SL37]